VEPKVPSGTVFKFMWRFKSEGRAGTNGVNSLLIQVPVAGQIPYDGWTPSPDAKPASNPPTTGTYAVGRPWRTGDGILFLTWLLRA
jgi:hypothetical protein